MKQIYIWAAGARGNGISGSDRIFIEFARRWQNPKTHVVVTTEGREMCLRNNLNDTQVNFLIVPSPQEKRFGFFISYFSTIISSIWYAFTIRVDDPSQSVVYSASEFWMDSIPAVILKFRYQKITWAATWYQTAPNPLKGFTESKRQNAYRLSAFYYWFMQLPVKPLISAFANKILVNNELERKQFPAANKQGKVEVVIGAVDTKKIIAYKENHKKPTKPIYDAVFQGRFHPQKGVVELIRIWSKVCLSHPTAKLAMIGDGPLMQTVRSEIAKYQLEENITLAGYVLDGDKKYYTFLNSKMVVHPAKYDSGGMAAAEAMSFDMPCIGFNLQAYKSYYPVGMVTSKNDEDFARNIIKLIKNETLRKRLGREAGIFVLRNYSWDIRAESVRIFITS